jgi:DNA primase
MMTKQERQELKSRAGIIPFARRLKIENDFSPCPFHKGDGAKSFHVLVTKNGAFVGTCFSQCAKSWDAIAFVQDFDKVSFRESARRITAELLSAEDDVKLLRTKKIVTPMTAELWGTRGDAVTCEDAARLAASRPHSVTPLAATLNAMGFKTTVSGFLVCPYRLGNTFYTVKGRRLTMKDFLQEHAVSQRGLFNIDAVTAGCNVYVVESELDAAVLYEAGYTAVSVISGKQRMIEPEVMTKLLTAARIVLIGDNDDEGVRCMDAIAKLLPPEKTYRMPLVGAKDIGELYQQRKSIEPIGVKPKEQVK